MDKLKYAIYLAIIVLTIGCASSTKMIMPEVKKTDTFSLGILQQKTVGEPMIVKMSLLYYPGFIAEKDYIASYMGLQFPTITRGSEWICSRKYENGDFRCKSVLNWGTVALPYGIKQSANMYNLIINSDGVLIGYVADPYDMVTPFSEKPKIFRMTEIAQSGSFKQELIYNGKSKDTIKITYREFKDNFARAAFSQDLIYDMTESKEIGFRGMVIEVVEATNSFIKFVVKQPMTQ
jgi:hypothetical protein